MTNSEFARIPRSPPLLLPKALLGDHSVTRRRASRIVRAFVRGAKLEEAAGELVQRGEVPLVLQQTRGVVPPFFALYHFALQEPAVYSDRFFRELLQCPWGIVSALGYYTAESLTRTSMARVATLLRAYQENWGVLEEMGDAFVTLGCDPPKRVGDVSTGVARLLYRCGVPEELLVEGPLDPRNFSARLSGG